MINEIYAKVILKPSFHWYREKLQKIWTTTRVLNLLYTLGYVSTNILQEKNKYMLCLSMVWYGHAKPNHHFSDGTKKKETSATKRIYNKSTHS